jgi:hypothetical protein
MPNPFTDKLKDSLPKKVSSIVSIICLAGTFLIQYGSSRTETADKLKRDDERITVLEKQMATKDAVDQMKQSIDTRFADLKEQLKQYHEDEIRFHHER